MEDEWGTRCCPNLVKFKIQWDSWKILERFHVVFSCREVRVYYYLFTIIFFFIILMHHLPPSDISPVRIEVIGGMFLKASGNWTTKLDCHGKLPCVMKQRSGRAITTNNGTNNDSHNDKGKTRKRKKEKQPQKNTYINETASKQKAKKLENIKWG